MRRGLLEIGHGFVVVAIVTEHDTIAWVIIFFDLGVLAESGGDPPCPAGAAELEARSRGIDSRSL